MPHLTDWVLKIMFSACSSQNIGHHHQISGFRGDLPRTSLNVQLEVSRSNGHDLCPVNEQTASSEGLKNRGKIEEKPCISVHS